MSTPAVDTPRKRATPLAVARKMRKAWRRISPFFGASRLKLVLLSIASVGAGLSEAALLTLIAAIASALTTGATTVSASLGPFALDAPLSTLFAVSLTLALVRGVLQIYMAYLPASMSAIAMANLRRRLFDAFTHAAWAVQSSQRDGYFQSLMVTHVNSTCQAIIALGSGITAVLMFVTLLASAFALSVPTAVVIIVASSLLLVVLRPLSRRLRRYSSTLSAENVEYSKGVQEVVLMAEETKVFGASDTYNQEFYRSIDAVRQPFMRTRFLGKAVPALFQSVALVLLVVALIVVSFANAAGIVALGAVVLILIRSLTYGQQIQTAVSAMDELLPFMNRLADAIEEYDENPQQDGSEPLPVIERLGLDDVHFSYSEGNDVLDGISFEAVKGESIGIVGPSGAGKSSVVQLLLRLRDPSTGCLQVNGQDARRFRRSEWQHRVAYVPQSPQLIWGTVADNIRFYRPKLTAEDIELAARRAHVHDEILSWPNGYNTVVGQRASAVSGGQRQRLCLARALAEHPDVLILDEPTSALDVRSELLVQESLRDLKGEVILFLVAHRLSTLADCDRVMVIVDGRLEAIDHPSRLLSTNDFYREVTEITRQQHAL